MSGVITLTPNFGDCLFPIGKKMVLLLNKSNTTFCERTRASQHFIAVATLEVQGAPTLINPVSLALYQTIYIFFYLNMSDFLKTLIFFFPIFISFQSFQPLWCFTEGFVSRLISKFLLNQTGLPGC